MRVLEPGARARQRRPLPLRGRETEAACSVSIQSHCAGDDRPASRRAPRAPRAAQRRRDRRGDPAAGGALPRGRGEIVWVTVGWETDYAYALSALVHEPMARSARRPAVASSPRSPRAAAAPGDLHVVQVLVARLLRHRPRLQLAPARDHDAALGAIATNFGVESTPAPLTSTATPSCAGGPLRQRLGGDARLRAEHRVSAARAGAQERRDRPRAINLADVGAAAAARGWRCAAVLRSLTRSGSDHWRRRGPWSC